MLKKLLQKLATNLAMKNPEYGWTSFKRIL